MSNSEQILNYILRDIKAEEEQKLFSSITHDKELRDEFNTFVLIDSTLKASSKSFVPPTDVTNNIFSSLGLSNPATTAIEEHTTVTSLSTKTKLFKGIVISLATITILMTTLVLTLLLDKTGNNMTSPNYENITKFTPGSAKADINHSSKAIPNHHPMANNNAEKHHSVVGAIDQSLNDTKNNINLKYIEKSNNNSNDIADVINQKTSRTKNITQNNMLDNNKSNQIAQASDLDNNKEEQEISRNQDPSESNRIIALITDPKSIQNNPLGISNDIDLKEKLFNSDDNPLYQSSYKLGDFNISLRHVPAWHENTPKTEPANIYLFKDFSLSADYKLNDNFALGMDIRQETAYLQYHGKEGKNLTYNYYQQPNLTSLSMHIKYIPYKTELLEPFVQLSVGANRIGLVTREMIGTRIDLFSRFWMTVGFEYNQQLFMYQNNLFNAKKYNINYGFGVDF